MFMFAPGFRDRHAKWTQSREKKNFEIFFCYFFFFLKQSLEALATRGFSLEMKNFILFLLGKATNIDEVVTLLAPRMLNFVNESLQ